MVFSLIKWKYVYFSIAVHENIIIGGAYSNSSYTSNKKLYEKTTSSRLLFS